MSQFTVDYFIRIEDCNQDSVKLYKSYFYYHQKPWNLALFVESFLNRDEINLLNLSKIPTLVIVGNNSAFIDESVYFNSQLDPKMTEWLKVSDSSGLVLEDRPAEVVQAFLLFIQGQGLCCDLDIHKIVSSLKGEMQSINKPNNRILTMEKVDEFNN
ncbi:unnamed protein product [Meloidogyne enterolobii]|uniref:Uncharacterized protein n=1 Tax=Meloidogyne enterolobii TaxID=390850 RepID=A0ACB0ZE44_MELEN